MKPAQRFRKPYRIKKKTPILKNRFFWLAILILFFIGVFIYFFIFSSFFQIKEIKISGNQKVKAEDLQEKISPQLTKSLLKFSSESIFLANLKKIKLNLLEKFPQIANITLNRKFPDSLILEIEERKPVAIFCLDQPCFLIDSAGIVFEEIVESSFEYPKIKDIHQTSNLSLGQKIFEEKILNFILEIERKFRESLKIDIEEFVLLSEERLNIKTVEGWEIYFALKEDLNWQLQKLSLVLEEEIPFEKRGFLEYIDLRFTRVYYKYR